MPHAAATGRWAQEPRSTRVSPNKFACTCFWDNARSSEASNRVPSNCKHRCLAYAIAGGNSLSYFIYDSSRACKCLDSVLHFLLILWHASHIDGRSSALFRFRHTSCLTPESLLLVSAYRLPSRCPDHGRGQPCTLWQLHPITA